MGQWLDRWIDDIDQLAFELPRRHANLYHQYSEQAFQTQVQQLKAELPECDDAMVVARLMALIASASDAHTTLIPPVTHYLPLEFYWFDEGLHCVAALTEHLDCLGSRVVAVERLPISEVTQQLTSILSHENDAYVHAHLPRYLAAADLLYGLEICDQTDTVELTFMHRDGSIEDRVFKTIRHPALTTGLKRLEDPTLEVEESGRLPRPLYRQGHDRTFWYTPLDAVAIYAQYNACRSMPDGALSSAFDELMAKIEQTAPRKLVLDLRNNHGGDSTLLEPLIDFLSQQMATGHNQMQIFTIIGRDTFSSALLNVYALKKRAGAIVVGEASGGKPNCYGEVLTFTLNYSRLRVRYSTQYYHLVDDDSLQSLMPDLPCPVTFADFLAGHDPCLAKILAQP